MREQFRDGIREMAYRATLERRYTTAVEIHSGQSGTFFILEFNPESIKYNFDLVLKSLWNEKEMDLSILYLQKECNFLRELKRDFPSSAILSKGVGVVKDPAIVKYVKQFYTLNKYQGFIIDKITVRNYTANGSFKDKVFLPTQKNMKKHIEETELDNIWFNLATLFYKERDEENAEETEIPSEDFKRFSEEEGVPLGADEQYIIYSEDYFEEILLKS